MYPGIYYLFERDNAARMITFSDFVDFIFVVIILMLSASIILPIIYYCWNLFTPGQQLLEIGMIIISCHILLLGKFIFDELTLKLSKKFDDLKEQNAELNKKITELNKKIAELESKNSQLSKDCELILECII